MLFILRERRAKIVCRYIQLQEEYIKDEQRYAIGAPNLTDVD